MESWQERVIEENKELEIKIDKLSAFLAGSYSLTDEDRWLLETQGTLMGLYSDVLRKRISQFKIKT